MPAFAMQLTCSGSALLATPMEQLKGMYHMVDEQWALGLEA